jgi:hypothetical protein
MKNRRPTFLAFLCLNLLAAYVPALSWVPGLPWSASAGWKYLFSPVLLVLFLLWTENQVVAWCVLIAFLALVGLASALLYQSRKAWAIVPWVLAIYCLLQGLLVALLINAINAIGHS